MARAATVAVPGHNLLGEALVTVTLVSAGVALTFYLPCIDHVSGRRDQFLQM